MSYIGQKPAERVLTSADISDAAITADKLASSSVTQPKVNSGVAGTGPAFSVYSSNSQTVSSNVWTKVALNTEYFDTNNNFDSVTNYRFTPTVAGYYQINWLIYNQGSGFNAYSQLYKNASGIAYGNASQPSTGISSQLSSGSYLVQMNGTTDYLELYSYTGGTNISSGATTTYMNGSLVRAA